MNGKIISVFTNKGGVGKTTTALSIAHGLAKKGVKTLLVDIDAQCNTTEPLIGMDPANNISEVLMGIKKVETCIRPLDFQKNFYCLPNSEDLTRLEPLLIGKGTDGFQILKQKIMEHCIKNYAITIIDCPPNFGIFVINALFCSQLAIVPIESGSRNSVKGLLAAQQFINELQDNGNPSLKLFKVLVTKLDKRTKIGKDYLAQIQNTFKNYVLKTHIPACVDFKYAENMNQTIFQNAPKSAGAKAYMKVISEIIDILDL